MNKLSEAQKRELRRAVRVGGLYTYTTNRLVLEALKRRGLIELADLEGNHTLYYPTDAGREAVSS